MNSISRQMAMVKFYVRRIYHNLKVFAKWAVFSSITGLVVGAFSTLFAECLKLVTQFRTANPWMILLLPLVGIVIVFLYHIFHYKNDKGTNMVLSTIHAETELPFKMAPLIFISTTLTHLFGGSAGREGAALQLGGSIGNQLGRWFRFDEKGSPHCGYVWYECRFFGYFWDSDRCRGLCDGGCQRRCYVLCSVGSLRFCVADCVKVCKTYGDWTGYISYKEDTGFFDCAKYKSDPARCLLCGGKCDLLCDAAFVGRFLSG